MRIAIIALIFLFGLFDLFMAISFLTDPVQAGVSFGLAANGAQGMSSLRGDFSAYFGVAAVCMMLGAWRRNGDLLLVPAALFGATFVVRAISLAIDGTYAGWQVPMLVEALHVALLYAAWRIIPHHRIEELTG